MSDFYRELILDHARNRRYWGLIDNPDFDHEEHNPLCGDHLHLTLSLDEHGIIQDIGWDGTGCAISQAAASMLGEELIGMPFEEARQIDKQHVLDLVGIPLTINRVKCALLCLKVIVVGAVGKDYWQQMEDED